MKKLFFALALTGIIGAVSVNTVSAMTHSKVIVNNGGDDKKKKEKCSKDKACCKSGTASADGKCSAGDKKCCHSKDAKAASSTDKSDVKKVEEQK